MNANETLPNWLKKRSELSPNRIALEYKDKKYTFLELHKEAAKMAGVLFQSGVKKGDKVGLLITNHPESVILIHSLFYLGATAVLLNNKLTPRELSFQLSDSNTELLITERCFSEKIKNLETTNVVFKEELVNVVNAKDFPIQKEFCLSDTATIMYTSGTTGNPKGVLQTFGNHWWSAVGSVLNLGLNEEDAWLCAVPIFHISGLSILMRSVIYGIRVILHESFDENKVNNEIMNRRVTIISVVAAMLNRLLNEIKEETYPKDFRCMLLGGGPAPKSLLEECKNKNIPVFQTYGMTETSSQIVTLSPEYSMEKLGSAGKPLFPSQIKIESNGKQAEANEPGEIVVKGPNVTSGYYRREKETKEKIQDGWLYTGDIGYLDEDGFLFVLDRRSDLIISGGENIYPAEIEAVLTSHPLVFEAGVTGMPHEIWGHVPCAFVVLRNNTDLTKQDILDFCKQNLAAYKVPKEVYFVDELPRNSSNKLLRRELLKLLQSGRE